MDVINYIIISCIAFRSMYMKLFACKSSFGFVFEQKIRDEPQIYYRESMEAGKGSQTFLNFEIQLIKFQLNKKI